MPPTTAFHVVDARKTFNTSHSDVSNNIQKAAAPAKAKPAKVDWPQSVRNYVQRAFMPEHKILGIERVEIEAKLKATITSANEKDALNSIDWTTLPLPQQLIQAERAAKIVNGSNVYVSAMPWLESVPLLASSGEKASFDREYPPLSSKKRKSSDLQNEPHYADEEATVPWRKNTNKRNLNLEDRLTFPGRVADLETESSISKYQKTKQNGSVLGHGYGYGDAMSEKRQKRFESGTTTTTGPHPWSSTRNVQSPLAVEPGPVIGTCTDLEKKYFRLTSAPNPSSVRPLHILRQTLDLLKARWRSESNYSYICDQFKSLRQDLTVQHIKTDFTVLVYETHARIALEKGDLGEYNQCQTQLRAFYPQIPSAGHPLEFKAYRILYLIHTCNRTDMNDVLAELTTAERRDAAVRHALEVRRALAGGNYHNFFRLYLETPNMGAYLMDMFVVRERLAALARIGRAYKPSLPLRFLTEELGFESDRQCLDFIVNDSLNGDESLIENRGSDEHPEVYVLVQKGAPIFERGKTLAFGRVDIKGQI